MHTARLNLAKNVHTSQVWAGPGTIRGCRTRMAAGSIPTKAGVSEPRPTSFLYMSIDSPIAHRARIQKGVKLNILISLHSKEPPLCP